MAQPLIEPSQIVVGTANGIAALDATGRLPATQLPTSVASALTFKGTWNASTNTPTLTSGVGTTGWEYVVSVAGTTLLDGISSWNIGDTVVYSGTAWQKIPSGGVASTIAVTSSTTNASFYVPFVGATTGNLPLYVDTLLYNPNTNTLTTTAFVGNLTGNVSATNITFADSTVLTTGTMHVNNPVSVTTATHTISATEDYIGVNYAGAVAITLTTISNKKVVIKDESFAASTPGHTITITPSSGLIEGQANVTITVNGMALTLICRAGNWFIV